MPNYKIGRTNPTITPDVGAGLWNSEATTVEMRAKKVAIISTLGAANAFIGDDAVKHIVHYFHNSGKNYTIDLEGLVHDVADEREVYNRELSEAKRYVETLPVGKHYITSRNARAGSYIEKNESYNWYFAVGGYSSWGKGVATVTAGANGRKSYELEFEYRFFDRYNWDGNKQVEIFGVVITDEFMGRFHREGLAKEFNMYGSYKKTVNWGHLSNSPTGRRESGGRRSR